MRYGKLRNERKKEILEAAKKLSNIPEFKDYKTIGFHFPSMKKYDTIVTADEQRRGYIQGAICQAAMVTMEGYNNIGKWQRIERWRTEFKNSPNIQEALDIVEKYYTQG